MNPKVQPGSLVSVLFTLSLASGEVIEQTEADEACDWVIGDGQFLPALEAVLMGAEPGQMVAAELSAAEAFGEHDASAIHRLPRSQFPQDMAFQVDDVIGFSLPNGEETPGRVLSFDELSVEVDFNHPLAGHSVIFAAQVVAVSEPGSKGSN